MFKLSGSKRISGKAAGPCGGGGDDESSWKLALESRHLLSIFPELVWKNIAKHLDSRDFYNLINSSPFFRNLFLKQRVQFLFKSVFEQLFLLETMPRDKKFEWIPYNEVQPLILNCRLVCRAWNRALCDVAQESFSWTNFHMLRSYRKVRHKYEDFRFINQAYEFIITTKKLDKFNEKFESSISNPFFGKTVFLYISTGNTDSDRTFHKKTVYVLNLFGRHVTNCIINFEQSYVEYTFPKLIDLLWCMPNLQNLRLISQESEFDQSQMESTRRPPTLEKLQSLEFQNVCQTICGPVVRKNSHVTALSIHQPFNEQNIGYLRYPYENLKHLDILWYNWNEIRCMKDSGIKWKLESITLQWHAEKADNYLTWKNIFNDLSQAFGESLESLTLYLHEMANQEEMSKLRNDMLQYRMDFPKLKHLSLHLKHCVPLDFILGVSESLEFLYISTHELTNDESLENLMKVKRLETVKLFSCFCKFCRSKFWKSFPKLQILDLRLYSHGVRIFENFYRSDWNKTFLGQNNCKILLTTCCKFRWTIKYISSILHFKRTQEIPERRRFIKL